MPTIKRVRLEGNQSVAERLHAAAVDLLPNYMMEHAAVKWVVQHDSMYRRSESDQGGNRFANYDQQNTSTVTEQLVTPILQQKITFYFASLFHIARLRSVSDSCRQNIENLFSRNSFDASSRNLAQLLSVDQGGDRFSVREEAVTILRRLSEVTAEHASRQQELAASWWTMWTQEAESLREVVNQFERIEGINRPYSSYDRGDVLAAAMNIILACQSTSSLSGAMKQAGVRLKSGVDIDARNATSLFGMIGLVIAGAINDDRLHGRDYGMRRIEHMISEVIHAEEKRRIQPEVDIALAILKEKYGAANPFDEYVSIYGTAMPELRLLVQEHKLPDGRSSPWLGSWENRLTRFHGSAYSPFYPPSVLAENSLEWSVCLADWSLKLNISAAINPTETWDDFLQRLYEKHWIEEVGKGAGGANEKAGKEFSVWTINAFYSFVKSVTQLLNSFGYKLQCPPEVRLKTLLSKTTHGISVWSQGDW